MRKEQRMNRVIVFVATIAMAAATTWGQYVTPATFTGRFCVTANGFYISPFSLDNAFATSTVQSGRFHLAARPGAGNSDAGLVLYYENPIPLGWLDGVTVAGTGSPAKINLWLDTGGDGSFFVFDGGTLTGVDGDTFAYGPSVVTNASTFYLSGGSSTGGTYTLAQLKAGIVPGIDASTKTALWIRVNQNESADIDSITVALPNLLSLGVAPGLRFVRPGQPVTVDLNVANLAQMVNGCQALIGYSSLYFSGPHSVSPGGGPWTELIYQRWFVPGELDTAIGVQLDGPAGTQADATVAMLTLTAGIREGLTHLAFRPDGAPGYATMLSDLNAQAVWPSKVDSVGIMIDGTPPAGLTLQADPAGWTHADSVVLTFAATDALSGVDHYELQVDGGTLFAATSPYTLSTTVLVEGSHTVTAHAFDRAGNAATASTAVRLDRTMPCVDLAIPSQFGVDMVGAAPSAVQGVVNITVTAADSMSGLNGPPSVTVEPTGAVGESAVYVGESPAGTFHFTWTVLSTTSNGSVQVGASASDMAGNTAWTPAKTFVVNKNQVTGQVELEGFTGTGTVPAHSRIVTFVASGGAAKTWTLALSNTSGSLMAYTLTDVPAGTTRISAKTAWNLRRRMTAFLDANGQAQVEFTGTHKLLGGDLNEDNGVSLLDYGILRGAWNTHSTAADINGDGQVQLLDYSILKSNWYQAGDPE
jgi:hypothetical protein